MEFEYTVDNEAQKTTAHDLSAGQILTNAGLNPAERYLIELHGKDQVPYKDPSTIVHMHQHPRVGDLLKLFLRLLHDDPPLVDHRDPIADVKRA